MAPLSVFSIAPVCLKAKEYWCPVRAAEDGDEDVSELFLMQVTELKVDVALGCWECTDGGWVSPDVRQKTGWMSKNCT